MAEMQALMSVTESNGQNLPSPRLFITDSLGDPYAAMTQFSSMTAPIGESRRQANAIKRGEPITVVIGNPPYKDKARGLGGWIEAGSSGRPSAMDLWTPPREWRVSAHAKHLKNLYVYFWRWATWKVFGSGHAATTGEPDTDRAGIVCFITAAGFLGGDGFQKIRDDLRRDCAAIWVINCSPEGHQPEVATRIFQGVQQPVCIVLAARAVGKDRSEPARLRFRTLAGGKREEKFAELTDIKLGDAGWVEGSSGWRDPFLPVPKGAWADYIKLEDFFVSASSGVLPGRTWVVAPDAKSLRDRWNRLIAERSPPIKEELFFPTLRDGKVADRHTKKIVNEGLYGHEFRSISVANDTSPVIEPTRFGFRSFDLQWIIPDNRLLLSARPKLWECQSSRQVHVMSLEKRAPENGPSLTFSAFLPDMNFYKGSSGGRVFSLWRDRAATIPNIKPALTAYIAARLEAPIGPEDILAYIAAVLAHPAFTARFSADLVVPGLRVPITADPSLFAEAANLGRETIWLHTYGERFADSVLGHSAGPPRLAKGEGPFIPAGRGIPGAPFPLPDTMDYDPALKRLKIGKGFVDNVPQAVWDYEVSGKNVMRQWFSCRKLDRTRPMIGDRRSPSPLEKIQPEHWIAEYTTALLDLIHVLGRLVRLEPAQADLLERVCAGPLISAEILAADGALVVSQQTGKRRKAKSANQAGLFGPS
jgi:hypothetical protein